MKSDLMQKYDSCMYYLMDSWSALTIKISILWIYYVYYGVYSSFLEKTWLGLLFLHTQLTCGQTRGSCLSEMMIIRDHRKIIILQ